MPLMAFPQPVSPFVGSGPPAGSSPALAVNCHVSISRAGVQVGAASIPAQVLEMKTLAPALSFQTAGSEQRRMVHMALTTDIQPTDDLLFLDINGLAPRKPGPFEVEDAFEDGNPNAVNSVLYVFLVGF